MRWRGQAAHLLGELLENGMALRIAPPPVKTFFGNAANTETKTSKSIVGRKNPR